MNLQNIWGPYYILFPFSVLTLITDSFKILEARRAISFRKLRTGKRKVQFSLSGKIGGTQHPLFHRKCHVLRRVNARQQSLLTSRHRRGEREEELRGVRNKAVSLSEEDFLLSSGVR